MKQQIEVKNTGGLGSLFYALIPAALGGASLMWLAFVTGCMDINQQRTIAQRMDNRVGVVGKLSAPVRLTIKQTECLRVDRAYMDGNELVTYIKNACNSSIRYWEFHWDAKSPDGTIIASDYTNYGIATPGYGESVEHRSTLSEDSRIALVQTYVSSVRLEN